MMGRCPFGEQTWLYLNWLCGLAASGHEVWYVEDDSVWPYDPKLNMITDNPRHRAFKPLLPVLLRLEGRQALARELKAIYRAETAEVAAKRLSEFEAGPWGKKYPMIAESWRRKWQRITPLLQLSAGGAKNHLYHQCH
jgi:hypothetical protein